ncbi:MAG: succinate dehydrogenase, hydrophobic membrane anchor protein [Enterobacterales bacterium]
MVNNKSSLGYSGVCEWLLVRSSAIVIICYVIYFLSFLIFTDIITYEVWCNFFNKIITKIFTIITILSISLHSWIGIWQILTDYIKLTSLRLVLQFFIIISLMIYICYGLIIVFGI